MDILLAPTFMGRALALLLGSLLGSSPYSSDYQSVCLVRSLGEDIRYEGRSPAVVPYLSLATTSVQQSNELDVNDLHAAIEAGCGGFIVSELALLPWLEQFHAAHQRSLQRIPNKRLIAIVSQLDGKMRRTLLPHRDALQQLVNVLLIVPNVTSAVIGLHTIELVAGSASDFRLIDEIPIERVPSMASNSSRLLESYFPDRLQNLHGRRIRVTTASYPPYAMWQEVPPGQGNADVVGDSRPRTVQLAGFEFLLILELCRRHNCTVEIMIETDWGTVEPNGSATGLIGNIVNRRADLVLAALYTWESWFQVASLTMPIEAAHVSCLVPKPQLLPFWQTPFRSFPSNMWLMVGLAFAAGTGAIYLIECAHSRLAMRVISVREEYECFSLLDALFVIFKLHVGQSLGVRYDRLVAGLILLVALLFGGFMIENSYAGALASLLTLPQYERSIDTVADFVANGMHWTGGTEAWMNTLAGTTQPDLVRIRDSFVVHDNDDEAVARLPFTDRRMGYVYERLQFGNYGYGSRITWNASLRLQPLREDVFNEFTVGACRKVWPLRAPLDALLLALHQSGIFHYWELTVGSGHHSLVNTNLL
ncbi:uncharacterized protein LOC126572643 [Anopheles aquasalis]|uniref:uncharacterized protein LOC126572643 n=1 Tax=Anopheles aquasalis TaxID=42839 RepID=UPI00215A2189|nr:uncharacterized protein LOC126572643 [Anopheles aquasalis]